jgi:hypothetical protein
MAQSTDKVCAGTRKSSVADEGEEKMAPARDEVFSCSQPRALQRDKHSVKEKSPVELLADVISLVNRAPLCPQKAKEITDAIHRLHSAHCLQYMNFHVQDEKELQLLFNDC